jgi:DNA (cytosine-5)-methyltransferase 1
LFLENYFEGKYCVENVIPYYEPLIPAQKRGRHLYWTNFNLPNDLNERKINIGGNKTTAKTSEVNHEFKALCKFHDYDFTKYKGEQRVDKMARNLVDYEAGRTIFETALGIIRKKDEKQISIFDQL